MNVQVSGHHVEVTPAIRGYVLTKLERIQRHFDHVIDINVILSVEKLRQKAEINVHVRGKDIYVESSEEDMYAAIDLMMDKLDRQIIKYKDKAFAHPHDTMKRQQAGDDPAG
jgi:putative sigma-54 modulation protein